MSGSLPRRQLRKHIDPTPKLDTSAGVQFFHELNDGRILGSGDFTRIEDEAQFKLVARLPESLGYISAEVGDIPSRPAKKSRLS
ncbi:hypothetical protein, partial [Luteolibacter algae]|uniref:hypothetical protein n=1 Tax=Luteolibacter algae TaxID=454151 RepID=UPI003A8DF16D